MCTRGGIHCPAWSRPRRARRAGLSIWLLEIQQVSRETQTALGIDDDRRANHADRLPRAVDDSVLPERERVGLAVHVDEVGFDFLGSPRGPVFYDISLEAGRTLYYRVRAVDAWGNRSPASAALAVAAK